MAASSSAACTPRRSSRRTSSRSSRRGCGAFRRRASTTSASATCSGGTRQYPDDWAKTWQLINEKYQLNPQYRRFSCTGPEDEFNIDAKINGAYIVMGLLYGRGDPDKTIVISMRCGQDSDCNPSNAGGILFTTIGFKKLPEKFTVALDPTGKFSHTPYDFPTLIGVCEKLARQAVVNCGGKIVTDEQGKEYFVIPGRSRARARWSSAGTPGRPWAAIHGAGDGPDHGRRRQGPVQGHREIRAGLEGQPSAARR